MKRSLEDAMNNAFKETTMKNVPIDQFGASIEEMKFKIGIYMKN